MNKKLLRTLLTACLVIFTILPNVAQAAATTDNSVQNIPVEEYSMQNTIQNAPIEHSIPELLTPGDRVIYFSQENFPHRYSIASTYGLVDLAAYRDWDFTSKSAPEFVYLSERCDTISLWATCDGEIDTAIICEILDMDHGGIYSKTLVFEGDESVKTYLLTLPAGVYKVWFVGDVNILKTKAMVVFTKDTESGILALKNAIQSFAKK